MKDETLWSSPNMRDRVNISIGSIVADLSSAHMIKESTVSICRLVAGLVGNVFTSNFYASL